jgi:hypothetical protein
MRFTYQPSAVARGTKTPNESVGVPVQGTVVEDAPVSAREPAGHDAGSVRHADGIRHPSLIKDHATLGNRVKVRSTNYFVSHKPDVVGALLVGNEEQNIGHACIITDHDRLGYR